MSLYRRGEIWHYDFTRDGHRHRGSTGLRDRRKAREFEERERERAALGSSREDSLALEDVAGRWFVARVAGKKSESSTALRLEVALRLLGPRTPITGIDTPQLAAAIQARRLEPTRQTRGSKAEKPVTNTTVNRDLVDTTMRPLMAYARRVLKIPVREVVWADLRLPEPPGRNRSFTAAELGAFRAALPHWHRPVFDFAARYGVRLREAFFTLDALDLEAGRVTLRQRKRGPAHTIPLLPEDAREMAARAGRARGAGLDTPWFREAASGLLSPVHWRGFQSACQRAVKEAGLPDARPVHDLRHHAGTAILRSTGNLQVARKLLGHEDIRSTARYAHADDHDVLEGLRHASATTRASASRKAS